MQPTGNGNGRRRHGGQTTLSFQWTVKHDENPGGRREVPTLPAGHLLANNIRLKTSGCPLPGSHLPSPPLPLRHRLTRCSRLVPFAFSSSAGTTLRYHWLKCPRNPCYRENRTPSHPSHFPHETSQSACATNAGASPVRL